MTKQSYAKANCSGCGKCIFTPSTPILTPLSLHPLFHPLNLSFLFSGNGAISSGAVLCILGSGMKRVCLSEGKSHRFALALGLAIDIIC